VTLGWTHREAYLRSSGILPFATAGLFAALAAGVVIARRRIDGEGAPGPVPSIPSVAVPLAAALAAALALSCWLGLRARPTAHPIAGTTATLSLPGSWSPSGPTDGPSLAFRKPSPGLFPPRLFVKRDALGGATPSQYLTRRVRESAASLARFRAFRIESWERHARDAWAVDFAFEQPQKDGSMLPLAGTTAVVPLGGEVLVLTLVASFQDRDALRWDLALAAQRLADEDGGDHRPDR
jgi:hypothetical protein